MSGLQDGPGLFSHRVGKNSTQQISIGSDSYLPLCRGCYLRQTNSKRTQTTTNDIMPRTRDESFLLNGFPLSRLPPLASPDSQPIEQKKRRGRKPKEEKYKRCTADSNITTDSPNVILHLKCSLSDLSSSDRTPSPEGTNETNLIETAVDKVGSSGDLTYAFLQAQQPKASFVLQEPISMAPQNTSNVDEDAYLWRKIKQLGSLLHENNISDKQSACFWCTCEFDSPPIFIPKSELSGRYNVYGCFCSPECGVAHLMEEKIDSSSKFERL